MAASDSPWQFSQADYSAQQWQRACLIDTEVGVPESKDRYRIPVREPSGAVNRLGVHDAVRRINELEGVPADKKAVAARSLASLFRIELAETPPDSLMNLTESGERSAPPPMETAYVSMWQKGGSQVSVRSAPAGGKGRVIGGYASVFEKRSQVLGSYVEVVERSCWNKSASENYPGVLCRYDHDPRMLLGTTASGTLRISLDNVGLDYSVDLPECRSDVYEYIDRGDVRNSSFAFQVYDDDWSHDGDGYPVRHLTSARLIDVSPVTTPAYLDATVGLRDATVALRSLSSFVGAPIEDVIKYSECNDLRKLFVRTDNDGTPKPVKPKSGRQAQMEILAMRPNDPIGEVDK
jgi:uncharacterized protein